MVQKKVVVWEGVMLKRDQRHCPLTTAINKCTAWAEAKAVAPKVRADHYHARPIIAIFARWSSPLASFLPRTIFNDWRPNNILLWEKNMALAQAMTALFSLSIWIMAKSQQYDNSNKIGTNTISGPVLSLLSREEFDVGEEGPKRAESVSVAVWRESWQWCHKSICQRHWRRQSARRTTILQTSALRFCPATLPLTWMCLLSLNSY